MDVIGRATNIFDKISLLIPERSEKTKLLTVGARQAVINELYKNNEKVEVVMFNGLIVDWMQANAQTIIIRGIRDSVDMACEWRMAHCNKILHEKIETLFLASSPMVSHISSTLVREIVACGGDLSPFVPKVVANALV